MGVEYDNDSLEEILRLERDNNRMLRAMRRSTLVGAILKTIIWLAVVFVPLWLYVQYLAPVMNNLTGAYQQVQGTGAAAQAQFGAMSEALQKFQSLFGGGQ